MGLKHELNLIVGVAAASALALLGGAEYVLLSDYFRKEVVDAKGRAMARALAPSCARALERSDDTQRVLDSLVADLTRERDSFGGSSLDLESLVVVDDDHPDASGRARHFRYGIGEESPDAALPPSSEALIQRARASAGDPQVDPPRWGAQGEALVDFAIPLRSGNSKRGVLWFSLSWARARQLFYRTLFVTVASTVMGAVIVWFLLYKVLKRRILYPIFELSRGIERVRAGDLTATVTVDRSKDEFGALVSSFNELVQMLREKPQIEQKLDEAGRVELERRRLAQAHSELGDAHAELKATKDRLVLAEKQASLGHFVRAIAHELKNPLNMSQNAVPSLEAALARLRTTFAGQASPEQEREVDEDLADVTASLELLKRSTTRAVSIIHDLQGFSQLGATDLASVDLRRVIDDAAVSCASALDGRVAVEVNFEGGKAIVLKAFPTLLVQVFVNLFTNAAQAIEGAGKIAVTARIEKERVHVEVKDTGPGIPKENLPRLFEPFFTTKAASGTGLGLTLCWAYVEKHGGAIEARSEPGKGATFVLDLPLEAKPGSAMSPRSSAVFEGPTDSVAEVARGRRGG